MPDEWSTTVTDWQGIDDEPTIGSDNLVKSGGVINKISSATVAAKKYSIKDVCTNKGYVDLTSGTPVIQIDNITFYSDFIDINDIYRVVTNGTSPSVYSILYFSEKELSSYLGYEMGRKEIFNAWYVFDGTLTPPANAKYVIIQNNTVDVLAVEDYYVVGKIYKESENNIKSSQIDCICINTGYLDIIGNSVSKVYNVYMGFSDFIKLDNNECFVRTIATNTSFYPVLYFGSKDYSSFLGYEEAKGDVIYNDSGTIFRVFEGKIVPPTGAYYMVVQYSRDARFVNVQNYFVVENIKNLKKALVWGNEYAVDYSKIYRYIITSFGYNDMKLSLYGTNNLTQLSTVNEQAIATINGVRDPSPKQINEDYYIIHTDGWGGNDKVGMIKTRDFRTFEILDSVSLYMNDGTLIENKPRIWAPAWINVDSFHNYVIVSIDFGAYIFEYDVQQNKLIHGVHLSLPFATTIDTHIYKENGNYYAVCRNTAADNDHIFICKSSTLFGTYTVVNSNISEITSYCEGQTVVRMDNGKLFMYFQDVSVPSGIIPIKYTVANNFEGNWSEPISVEFDADKSSFRPSHPDYIDFMKFGTGFSL